MKLARIGEPGAEQPVIAREGGYIPVDDVVTDFDEAFFAAGGLGLLTQAAQRPVVAWDDRRVGAPIGRPHQIVCVGLNYSDHARETGQDIPAEPILFTKSPNTLVGPHDDVVMPRGATKLDWEVELGIVIGARASYLDSEAEAAAAIAGYVLVNDVSERAFQAERGGQWSKGKSAPTFNPCGPYLVSADEVGDPLDLGMWLDVNGRRYQDGSTSTMVFSPLHVVHYISQFMTLEPGDLINTGTPPGVGLGQKPPVYLSEGDVMTLGIDGLGEQRQKVVPWRR